MNIKKILEEIYMIDPELKNHESDLKKIIIELTKQKPDVIIDQVFIKTLREKIMPQENLQSENIAEEKPKMFNFANLAFSGVGAIVMLLIVLPLLLPDKDASVKNLVSRSNQLESKIIDKGSHAFGLLVGSGDVKEESAASNAIADTDGAQTAKSTASRTMGMGGGGAGGEFLATQDSKMIAPYFPSYEYKYVGEELTLESGDANVYKKVKGDGFNVVTENILNNIDLAPAISKLVNPTLQSFSLSEDREYGFQVYVNVQEGTIDFNQNWSKWQAYYPKCNDEACWERNRMKIEDMPSNEQVLALAGEFLTNYGIDLSNYGPAVVRDDWRKQYEQSADKTFVYIPEEVQVIYPYIVNGETVYDGSGYPYGVNVNVNVKLNKVSSFYSLRADNYESSSYALETDKDKIVKIAERGGSYGPIYYMEGDNGTEVKKEIVELGTPKKILMSHWHYDEATQETYELFVPALNFPIVKAPENGQYFYQNSVTIPLVKEILDSYDMNNGGGDKPMPLLREGDAAASDTPKTMDAPVEDFTAPESNEIDAVKPVMPRN